MLVYKLTDADGRTSDGYQWELGVTSVVNGKGDLRGPGWFRWHNSPEVEVLMGGMLGHSSPLSMRLFEAEAGGEVCRDDYYNIEGFSTELTLVREIVPPVITVEQREKIAILCAKKVCNNARWLSWAEFWLSGEDRSEESAYATMRAVVLKVNTSALVAVQMVASVSDVTEGTGVAMRFAALESWGDLMEDLQSIISSVLGESHEL
jgi:hypothetical protein